MWYRSVVGDDLYITCLLYLSSHIRKHGYTKRLSWIAVTVPMQYVAHTSANVWQQILCNLESLSHRYQQERTTSTGFSLVFLPGVNRSDIVHGGNKMDDADQALDGRNWEADDRKQLERANSKNWNMIHRNAVTIITAVDNLTQKQNTGNYLPLYHRCTAIVLLVFCDQYLYNVDVPYSRGKAVFVRFRCAL